ncbi:MAG: hypothetical protein C4545_06595 [Anaerolineaceae bacterium]|nr:MAG: hypothetical protein C4545_06595 [Anaerolineaceae bacterium]
MNIKSYRLTMNNQKSMRISMFLCLVFLTGCLRDTNAIILRTSNEPAELIVEEYEIVDTNTDSPTHFEFLQRITLDITEKRARWKNLAPDLAVQDINAVLTKYGYTIEHDPMLSSYTYRLFKGYTILLDAAYPLGYATENQDQRDFALMLQTYDGTTYLLQKAGLEKWQSDEGFSYAPIYYQDDLIYPVIASTIQITSESGQTIYETSLPSNPVMNPIQTFQAWNGHWILEKEGELIIDGESLNKELGFQEIFNWQIIQGEPLFFFQEEKDGPYSMMYAGQQLDHKYDSIVHYQCCEPAAFNPAGNTYMVWFYASRDGKWYYVEAGVYPELND